ncbi:MAG: hypothetical protein P8Y66_07890 [Nitrospirota bacterium]
MSRRLPEEFKDETLAPLSVASRLGEARQVEAVLDEAGVDYTVDIVELASTGVMGILFGSVKKGVMFLVPEERRAFCRDLLVRAGLEGLLTD